ncbi:unnamed protein product [Rotaria sordida]|uniref:Uncharacterized protein n=2 Tax=Rotaria sordida TaxID=392033 RepID=A0A815BGV1_9BILA|nr:unnamed protein product [Rotaria sordida]
MCRAKNTSNDDSINRAVYDNVDLQTEIAGLREAIEQLNINLTIERQKNALQRQQIDQLNVSLTAERLSTVAQLIDLMIQKTDNEEVSRFLM